MAHFHVAWRRVHRLPALATIYILSFLLGLTEDLPFPAPYLNRALAHLILHPANKRRGRGE